MHPLVALLTATVFHVLHSHQLALVLARLHEARRILIERRIYADAQ